MRIETSKLILLVDITIAVAVTVSVILGERSGFDMTSSALVAGLWDAQLAVAVGFYYWKSKNENRAKYAQQLVKELADKYGMDSVARIAEIILRD